VKLLTQKEVVAIINQQKGKGCCCKGHQRLIIFGQPAKFGLQPEVP